MKDHSRLFFDKKDGCWGTPPSTWKFGRWGSISYFLATRSSQMNAEAASAVDPKY